MLHQPPKYPWPALIVCLLSLALIMGCTRPIPEDTIQTDPDAITDNNTVDPNGDNLQDDDLDPDTEPDDQTDPVDEIGSDNDPDGPDENPFEDMDFSDQFAPPSAGDYVAILNTSLGTIKMRLFESAAPLAVDNFVTLIEEGYYEGVIFHRVMQDFMIQGGDPTGTGRGGESIYGAPFPDEFSIEYLPYRGALCMANSGVNTNGSQFFVMHSGPDAVIEEYADAMRQGNYPEAVVANYETYGGAPWLFFRHTVFGQVYEGMDIVDAIALVETDGDDRPLEEIVIVSAEAYRYE